jgi:hypothetical protein
MFEAQHSLHSPLNRMDTSMNKPCLTCGVLLMLQLVLVKFGFLLPATGFLYIPCICNFTRVPVDVTTSEVWSFLASVHQEIGVALCKGNFPAGPMGFNCTLELVVMHEFLGCLFPRMKWNRLLVI